MLSNFADTILRQSMNHRPDEKSSVNLRALETQYQFVHPLIHGSYTQVTKSSSTDRSLPLSSIFSLNYPILAFPITSAQSPSMNRDASNRRPTDNTPKLSQSAMLGQETI